MSPSDQSIKAAVDTYVVLAGVATFVGDVLPGIAVLAALILSVIRVVNEWPQLRKTVKGWFRPQ